MSENISIPRSKINKIVEALEDAILTLRGDKDE